MFVTENRASAAIGVAPGGAVVMARTCGGRRESHIRPARDLSFGPVALEPISSTMRYVIGLSILLGVLTWRSGDVQHGTDLLIQALAQTR